LVVGSGKIGGYSVLNMHSSYQVAKFMDVFVRALNLLDHKYATAGFLTSNSFDPNGTFRADPDHWTNENALSAAQP
jgi:outer membrane receptor for monomeric catechols